MTNIPSICEIKMVQHHFSWLCNEEDSLLMLKKCFILIVLIYHKCVRLRTASCACPPLWARVLPRARNVDAYKVNITTG